VSISTLESPASVRALDSYHATQDRQASAERGVAQEIKEAFHLLGVVPSARIALPEADGVKQREGVVNMRAAMLELIHEGHCDDELMALLESGPGELVDNLRTVLRDKFIENNARDVAFYRV
jgi:hypothetical protein